MGYLWFKYLIFLIFTFNEISYDRFFEFYFLQLYVFAKTTP